MPLPESYRFPAEAVAAARTKGLTDEAIAKALQAFRRKVGDDKRTPATWDKAGTAYLATTEAPKPDEMVTVGCIMAGGYRKIQRSQVKPWESWVDSDGVRHLARKPKPGVAV